MNLNDNPRGGTFCLSKAGLTIGTTAAGATTAIAFAAPNGAGVDYAINGLAYTLTDVASVLVTATNQDGTVITPQADETDCLYLVQLDTSGTPTMLKGKEITTGSGDSLRYPIPEDDNCAVGYVKIVTDGTTFTAGTDALDKASTTDTYVDVFAPPPEPTT